MSEYDNVMISSDLDAFKNKGVKVGSITMSGTVPASGTLTSSTGLIAVTDPDYGQFLYDNNQKHPGKYRNIAIDRITMITDNTSPGEVVCSMSVIIANGGVEITGTLRNPYGYNVAIQTTVINFIYIPSESTV